MINKAFLYILIFGFVALSSFGTYAQDVAKDSTTTSFRKGRWHAGLSGSISSGSSSNSPNSEKNKSNRYRIEASVGKFVIDRLNVGIITFMERSNSENEIQSSVENIFFGPQATYFLSKSEIGSVFFSFAPGVVLYRDELSLIVDDLLVETTNDGIGFGTLATFGYAYVIRDLVTLDIGLNYSIYWVNIDQESSETSQTESLTFEINDLSFSFGFKILLDSKSVR